MSVPQLFAQTFRDKTFSVSELTGIIKEMLEGSFPFVHIEGEISNCRPASTGHLYFTLKDAGAAISAVMFKGKMKSLTFAPADGTLVRVKGSISVYALRGNYQIVVESMELAGTGNILQMLEERKRRLAAEGLFDSRRKRPLPFFPQTIGVVTSPTGAALRDILQITRRRNPKVSVTVLPCAVQGSDAAQAIVRMIETANAYRLADVLIVGRGGGSLEDLLPFSEESVVRAVAASEIPIVSAVGHEIDWALSDFAADVRAPTPSAAAELVTPLLTDLYAGIDRIKRDVYHTVETRLERMRLLVRSFTPESLELRFRTIEQPLLADFDDAKEALLGNMQCKCDELRRRITAAVRDLEGANPSAILARGYSMVRNPHTGAVVRSPADTAIGQTLEIIPASGRITVSVTGAE
ncbi:exodeoxyribonuclease VII large subunit [Treponema brennaborense]|uniref:Exodeoxyribonuclease 7 large subunit n=1 Tax=Treponema brennaborense (strain DSM 12168 / CIP 105900 / DD5/3) TaxID=906968 RepID=F4LIN7_TREBD|nr:exodeoxyribonuclease VII large subunit [Treponema brennaborense]AEE17262.1 Exodeoxyribonuclease 7 large subunit [Treponema brennaborense DSM 12168]